MKTVFLVRKNEKEGIIVRLDKLIEARLQTNRKAQKRLFLTGQVKVDGKVERQENRNVDSRLHKIEVAGKGLETGENYFLLHKPKGVVCANRDSEHETVLDLIAPVDRKKGLYTVGRLDRDTEGLLLVTDNGQLGYELLQPNRKVAKVYEAWVKEPVTSEDVTAFEQGITFYGGVTCQPAVLEILEVTPGPTKIRLTIQEGKFHQVKKMFLARGIKVLYLRRVAMGPLVLPNDLLPKEYRELTLSELQSLQDYFR